MVSPFPLANVLEWFFSAGRGRPGEPFPLSGWHTLDDGDVARGGCGHRWRDPGPEAFLDDVI
jgi:hypothetical protein